MPLIPPFCIFTKIQVESMTSKRKGIYQMLGYFAMLSTLNSSGQQHLYTFPFGVQAYTFRKNFLIDAAKTLDTIRMMGFSEIEGGGGTVPPAEFKKLCDERSIAIPSTGASYEELIRSPDSVGDRAKILGSSYVMCAWIPHEGGKFNLENARKAAEDFNTLGKKLAARGLVFCYHAHGYEFQPYAGGTLLDYLFEHTDPRYVSFEMDIFWVKFGGGDPVTLLRKYADRWKLMHLKDMRKGIPTDLTGLTSPENDVPLGSGQLDIPAIIREAKKVGITHYFIEDESDAVDKQVPQSIQYLKKL
jgi:sugar phosphate isomerase/epimerase